MDDSGPMAWVCIMNIYLFFAMLFYCRSATGIEDNREFLKNRFLSYDVCIMTLTAVLSLWGFVSMVSLGFSFGYSGYEN